MITVRRSADRGAADHGWLQSRHTFSFADYRDPAHMGFRSLRVINEDVVAVGTGFGAHPHRDMEILTFVLRGALRHRDSMGNEGTIRAGEVQAMSAGTGVVHSEHSDGSEPVHFLQIWIRPDRHGATPRYAQRALDRDAMHNRLALVAGPDGSGAPLAIRQDATLLATDLDRGSVVEHALAKGRGAWIQVTSGRIRIGDLELSAGDGAAVEGEATVSLLAIEPAQALVFDLR